MEQAKIDRINALARKSRSEEGLTPAEREEQQALRKEYIAAVTASLKGQLDHTYLVRPDGTKEKLHKKS